MRAVIQRVKEARVVVAGQITGEIGFGLLVFIGIARDDTFRDVAWMVDKIINLRIFEPEVVSDGEPQPEAKLDKSVLDIGGGLLLVSQFTLYGDCRKGRRPSFSDAMDSKEARRMFAQIVDKARETVPSVATGVFQTHMEVSLVNDGPVTIILDSKT
jgi:D-aminoacyl-tRNA deacylase